MLVEKVVAEAKGVDTLVHIQLSAEELSSFRKLASDANGYCPGGREKGFQFIEALRDLLINA